MDGISDDRVVSGRLLRPVSLDFAVTTFPPYILALKLGSLQLNFSNSVGSVETVAMWVGPMQSPPLIVLRSDFDSIKKIAQQTIVRLYPSDTTADALRRIKGLVQVEFAGRGVPV